MLLGGSGCVHGGGELSGRRVHAALIGCECGGRIVGLTRGVLRGAQQIASDGLKGRVFEVSLADLQNDEDQAFRKIKLRAEDVQGKNVLTNFWVRGVRRGVSVSVG